MQYQVDKQSVLVAATLFVQNIIPEDSCYLNEVQRYVDILSGPKAHMIGSTVLLDDYEFELLAPYLEEL